MFFSLLITFIGYGIITVAIYSLQHTPNSLVRLHAFFKRTFRTTFSGGSLFRIALCSSPFILPLMFQVAFGWTTITAGTLLLSLFTGNIIKLITTPLIHKFGFRNILIINGLLVSISFILCAFFTKQTPIVWIIITLFFSGGVRSIQFTTLNTMGFSEIEKNEVQSANILSTIAQQINNVLGIVLGALFLFISALYHGHNKTAVTIEDFKLALLIIVSLTILALTNFIALPKGIGDHVREQNRG